MQVWVVSAQVPPFLQVPGRHVGFEVPVGPTDGNKVVDEVDFDGDPAIDFDVNTDGTLDCKTAVDMVIDSKRNVDLKKDEGVSLDVRVDNAGFDATGDVTLKSELLDAVSFSGECGVCKLTENIVGLDSEGIVDNVAPKNKENNGKKGEATVTSTFSHRYEPVINPVK